MPRFVVLRYGVAILAAVIALAIKALLSQIFSFEIPLNAARIHATMRRAGGEHHSMDGKVERGKNTIVEEVLAGGGATFTVRLPLNSEIRAGNNSVNG
jgi:hypothetical protein